MVLYGSMLLLLLGGIQGLLLGLLLMRRKARPRGYVFLILYLAVMLAQIGFKILDKWWLMQHLLITYNISYKLPLLYGPLAWLFVRYLAGEDHPPKLPALHFLPFLGGALCIWLGFAGYWFPWYEWLYKGWPGMFWQLVVIAAYHYSAHQICVRYGANEGAGQQLLWTWVRRFVELSWVVTSVVSFLLTLLHETYPRLAVLRFGFVLLTLFIYWVSYWVMRAPRLFGMDDPAGNREPEKKYARSTLKEEEAERIARVLAGLMRGERVYTDPELTIEKLAARLDTNRHNLSQVLNERLQLSYFDYINNLRVEEAGKMLGSPACRRLKIADIAYDAGFNSLSVFNDAFKKITGRTPSDYRRAAQKNGKIVPDRSVR
ncbi:MAG TPA: AraC family transcriptional regulator [Flavilitoribacter sp.]|nr:AraC family transcriptional regulator [Flavilitoribacter sp.]HMQ89226.1 AraC family transcriptional regulator [Flavilitoribacter sp.]